jgi:hypothetical protein
MKTKKITKNELMNTDHQFHYWGAMKYYLDLIKSSELKAGLILSFFGIVFNFVYLNINKVIECYVDFKFIIVIVILWLISTVLAMYYSINTFIPRIEKKYEPNLFFFGDIITKFGDIKEYSETFLNAVVDREKIYDQLGQQIYINAKITATKFKNVNNSIKFLVYSIILLALIIVTVVIKSFLE